MTGILKYIIITFFSYYKNAINVVIMIGFPKYIIIAFFYYKNVTGQLIMIDKFHLS